MAKDGEIKIKQIVQMVKRGGNFKVLRSRLERRKFKRGGQDYFGNGMKESKYWVSEENRDCRLCDLDEKTWEHVWQVCGRSKKKDDRPTLEGF